MPNDAKFGLLVGAAAVLAAALMMGPKPAPAGAVNTAPPAAVVSKAPPAKAAVPAKPRTKPELEATPVARKTDR